MVTQFSPDTTPEERGMLRAITQGVQVQSVCNGRWWTSSTTTPGTVYVTTLDSYDCPAGQAGRYCKHRAAVTCSRQRRD